MEKKQSSVEWLEWQINLGLSERGLISAFKEAKEMHKEEIETAYIQSMKDNMIAPLDFEVYKPEAEEYYNQTYKNEK